MKKTFEVRMQKDGNYQVIVTEPGGKIDTHVSDFDSEAQAIAWVKAQQTQ